MKKMKIIGMVLLLLILSSIVLLTSCVAYSASEGLVFMEVEGGYWVSPLPFGTSLEEIGKNVLFTFSVDIPSEYNGKPVEGINDFSNLHFLINITIPDTITYVNANAFGLLVQYNEYDNALYLGNENNPYVALIKAKNTKITSCEIHPDTKCIANEAFKGCKSLTSITLPDSVKSIGGYAFQNCSSLESVTIPNSVTSIREWAFSGCTSLESVTLPNSMTSIGGWAFSGCTSLESMTIPNSVTVIGCLAFSGCTSLTSVTLENTDGWWGTLGFGDKEDFLSLDFENPAKVAEYLTSTYCWYEWSRTE